MMPLVSVTLTIETESSARRYSSSVHRFVRMDELRNERTSFRKKAVTLTGSAWKSLALVANATASSSSTSSNSYNSAADQNRYPIRVSVIFQTGKSLPWETEKFVQASISNQNKTDTNCTNDSLTCPSLCWEGSVMNRLDNMSSRTASGRNHSDQKSVTMAFDSELGTEWMSCFIGG